MVKGEYLVMLMGLYLVTCFFVCTVGFFLL
jgi:hypothetical protein